MGLIELLPPQPHHIRLNANDKEGQTSAMTPQGHGYMVTSRNISTGSVPVLVEGVPNSPNFMTTILYNWVNPYLYTCIPKQRRQKVPVPVI